MKYTHRLTIVLLLSAAIGFISLSQEILWVQAVAYATAGIPQVFGRILGFFLLGIGFGALLGKWVSGRDTIHPQIFIAVVLGCSAVVYFLSLPISAQLMTWSVALGMAAFHLNIGVIAFMLGGIFPLLCHLGVESDKAVGERVSWVYVANIVGSVAGPLLTGFVLMNLLTLEQTVLLISMLTLALGGAVLVGTPMSVSRKVVSVTGVALVLAGMAATYDSVYAGLLEKLHYKTNYLRYERYKHVVQNRSGIVSVEAHKDGDIVYGGGVYDGRFQLDPVVNSNGITRAYMIAALHPEPRDVLEVGLSTGSWARVIADYQPVERLAIVEINPGYTEIVGEHPEIGSVLDEDKVSLYVDDGRRWLSRNPDRRFDLIVMNTTFHWRNSASNLLSLDFLRILKSHLKPGGVIYYNATGSADVAYTATQSFLHVTAVSNFVAASDTPFDLPVERRRENLTRFVRNGEPVFSEDSVEKWRVLEQLANTELPDLNAQLASRGDLWVITDDNMAPEYKRVRGATAMHFDARLRWSTLIARLQQSSNPPDTAAAPPR